MLLFSLFNPCEARRKMPVLFCARPLRRSAHDLCGARRMTPATLGARPLRRSAHDLSTARCTTPAPLGVRPLHNFSAVIISVKRRARLSEIVGRSMPSAKSTVQPGLSRKDGWRAIPGANILKKSYKDYRC